MYRAYIFLLGFAALGCGDGQTSASSQLSGDVSQTTAVSSSQNLPTLLDSLLIYKSEAELRKVFGDASITYDTAWGPEGTNWMCTYLYPDTPDEVQITWHNEANRSDLLMLKISGTSYTEKPIVYTGRWKIKSGVLPGITLEKLEQLNGKPFTFSGFGWDYGGGVAGWDGGKLDNSGISVQLRESPLIYEFMEQTELARVLGDQQVSSREPVLKKMNVQVAEVMLSPEMK